MAIVALQNWVCNAPKPLRSSRLPNPISSPHQFMKLSNVKISSRIISYTLPPNFGTLGHFNWQNNVILFTPTVIFVTSWQTGGAKKWGRELHPCSNVELPLAGPPRENSAKCCSTYFIGDAFSVTESWNWFKNRCSVSILEVPKTVRIGVGNGTDHHRCFSPSE